MSKIIKPESLLQLLKKYLDGNGGIKEEAEMTTVLNIMKKFSLKLVSKCVYLRILLATNPDKQTEFLVKGGWEILDHW